MITNILKLYYNYINYIIINNKNFKKWISMLYIFCFLISFLKIAEFELLYIYQYISYFFHDIILILFISRCAILASNRIFIMVYMLYVFHAR